MIATALWFIGLVVTICVILRVVGAIFVGTVMAVHGISDVVRDRSWWRGLLDIVLVLSLIALTEVGVLVWVATHQSP
jgi:NADH:ubiquinone oxidoreductase subunit 6 (subunit J)